MWDIRAQAMVYELATGNNSVEALAWDTARSVLYAATECPGMDRLGFRHDYRPAKIPKWADFEPEEGDDDDMDEDDDEFDGLDEDEDFDELERCWPDDAFHSETAFGYAYDAGHHTLREFLSQISAQALTKCGHSGLLVQGGSRLHSASGVWGCKG